MAVTGFWFQRARGRALVRQKAMRAARSWAWSIERGSIEALRDALRRTDDARGGPRALRISFYALDDAMIRRMAASELAFQVRRARQANRDWREYRALHAKFER